MYLIDSDVLITAKNSYYAFDLCWLVAYARVHGCMIVTLEMPRPESRNQIKLPDVCLQFDVSYENVFTMLRTLKVQYN